MKHYVYRIDNLINGKYYIGKHSAKSLDNSYMGSGIHIRAAIDLYGIDNFKKTILKTFPTSEEAYAYEAELVTQELVDDPMCYNIMKGGTGGSEKKFTDEELKEHWRKYYSEYRKKHREEDYQKYYCEYLKRWHEKNPNYMQDYNREYYQRNKEHLRERNREYQHGEKYKEYRRKRYAKKKAERLAQLDNATK